MTCYRKVCRLLGHKWLTLKVDDDKTACYRLSYDSFDLDEPILFQLHCIRSGEWHEVVRKNFVKYLSKYPLAKEVVQEYYEEPPCNCGECREF